MTRDAVVWHTPEREEDRYLPEGPRAVTLGGRAAVAWVNIQTAADATTGSIFARFWDTGEVLRFDLPDRPGFFLPTDRPDTLLVGAGKRLLLVNPLTGAVEEVATIPDASPRTIINDGEVMPGGRAVVFGTKDVQFREPLGHLYLFDPADRSVTPLAGGMTCSNGKVIRPGKPWVNLYDIDTPRRRVDVYRLHNRRLSGPNQSCDLGAEPGFPDGMAEADDETEVIAFYDPASPAYGRAVRYDCTEGRRLDEWRTPGSPRVTCPLLVGGKLILTTAVEGMPAEQRAMCPNAGCLFIADADGLDPPATEPVRFGS